jgi:hypothetical protein
MDDCIKETCEPRIPHHITEAVRIAHTIRDFVPPPWSDAHPRLKKQKMRLFLFAGTDELAHVRYLMTRMKAVVSEVGADFLRMIVSHGIFQKAVLPGKRAIIRYWGGKLGYSLLSLMGGRTDCA